MIIVFDEVVVNCGAGVAGLGLINWPSLGWVMRLRILRRVDLPAPLRPMTSTTSPRCTAKETFFNAQITSSSSVRPCPFWLNVDRRRKLRVGWRSWCSSAPVRSPVEGLALSVAEVVSCCSSLTPMRPGLSSVEG